MNVKRELMYDEFRVERRKPENLITEEESFFSNEYVRVFPKTYINWYKDVYVNTQGVVFKGFKVFSSSSRLNGKISTFNLLKEKTKRVKKIKGTALLIYDDWYEGYYHWFADSITRLMAVPLSKEITLLMPQRVKDYHLESFKPFKKIKAIEFIKDNELFSCESLIVPDHPAGTGNYHLENVNLIRDKYINQFSTKLNTNIHPYLFISRRKATRRKVINEVELELLLRPLGFVFLTLEDFVFAKQVDIISKAKIIISPHGSGLTNLLFAKQGTKVLELRPDGDTTNLCYYSLADALKIKYFYLMCHVQATNLVVEKDKFIEVVEKMLKDD